MSVNRAMVIGRLGKDPQVTVFGSGKKVANFNIASDESYRDADGQKVAKTEWHRVVMFGKLAEVAELYLQKGRLIHVEGKLQTRDYTGEDKVKRYVTEIVASNMTMLDSQKVPEPPAAGEEYYGGDFVPDDVPF